MCKKILFSVFVVWLLCVAKGASAGHFAELKVDFALVNCPDTNTIRPESAKPGWWHWAVKGWSDMYMHDMRWEDGSISPKPTGPGIDGTGVHACITTGSEGQLGLHMKDLCRDNLGGEGCPYGSPAGDPIANTWFYAVDWAGPEAGDILLLLTDLPAGEYWLYSYHNHWEPCTKSTRNCMRCECGMPPMPTITANPLPSSPPPGYNGYGLPLGTGTGVTQIENAYNVWPTHYFSDDDLVPSLIKFETDGNEVLVIYEADNSLWPDCARSGREGSRAILNAFRLQFAGELRYAYRPTPARVAENVSPDATLSWKAGAHAAWHDVYFGSDFGSVRDATTASDPNNVYMGRQDVEDVNYDPTPTGLLEFDQTYYWRIDEVNEPNVWTGDVWSFTVYEARASSPTPADGSKDMPRDVELGWSPGFVAASHDVYFGTDFEDVHEADTSSPEYKGNQPLEADSYGAGGLALNSACYWRIDEVNGPSTWKGDVWGFTVKEYILVDDMESYDGSEDLRSTWKCYPYPDFDNGAYVSLEEATVHGGEKSMRYEYDVSYSYCTATRIYPAGQNWAVEGGHMLLWFHGGQYNPTEDQMYVTLKDGIGHSKKVSYSGDANDIATEEWQQWIIEMSRFSDGGVELTGVNEFVLGVEGPSFWVGTICYDDIGLYSQACVAEFGPVADFTGDCLVGLEDFAILGSQWLQAPGSPSADIAPASPDGFVDWRDLAALADSWLEEQLWPAEE